LLAAVARDVPHPGNQHAANDEAKFVSAADKAVLAAVAEASQLLL
jgi:hypothetical protein